MDIVDFLSELFGRESTVRVLVYLLEEGDSNVYELSEEVGLGKSTVDRSLHDLKDLGMVKGSRENGEWGNRKYWSLKNKETVGKLIKIVKTIKTESKINEN